MKVKEESEKVGLKLNILKTNIKASSPITSWQINGKTMETVREFIFEVPKSLQILTAAMKLKDTCSLEESYDQPRQHIKKQRHHFANKGPSSQSYGFFLVVMYGCVCWTLKKAEHRRIDAFELWYWRRPLRVPWDCKEIQPVHPKGNQSWVFIGRTDVEAEAPILWPPNSKNWLTGEDPDAGKDWRQEEKGMTKVEMVGWHPRLDGHEFD